MIDPIVLIAELHSQGIDLEWHDGIVFYIGDTGRMTASLQADLDGNDRALTAYVSSMQEGTLR